MKLRLYAIATSICLTALAGGAVSYTCMSPDKLLICKVDVTGEEMVLSVTDATDNASVLQPSPIAMVWDDGTIWGPAMKVKRVVRKSVSEIVPSPFYKQAEIVDQYNLIVLEAKDFALEVRAYNDGVAYRFVNHAKKGRVSDELAQYNFGGNPMVWAAYTPPRSKAKNPNIEQMLHTDMQGRYLHVPITKLDSSRLIYTPLLVDISAGRRVALGETDVCDYPGMYLKATDNGFTGYSAREPKRTEQGGHNDLEYVVVERNQWLVAVDESRTFPWRAIMLSRDDKELPLNDMLYRLAPTSQIEDVSWIKPGKVAWDWWCAWNLRDVDFEAGINTATYKRFIDFASDHEIEYVILDEGWATKGACDLFDVVSEINLKEIVDYANGKGVGIILWAGFLPMHLQLDEVAAHYAAMGIKGFKIDFLNRDDATMMRFMERAAQVCARHHLLIDFHGCTKPTGLQRAWPNVVNFEAVFGLEQMKWTKGEPDMPVHDVTLPFTRLLAGPMDYTQGAMRNFIRGEYHPDRNHPGSQGTRAHQLAEYVIFDAPLTMLCDSPTDYEREPESLRIISSVPTVWDETRVLDAIVGEYIVEARRKGSQWWIAAINNWQPRSLSVELPPDIAQELTETGLDAIADGANAHRDARDIKRFATAIGSDNTLTIEMAPGGGFIAVGAIVNY